MKITFDQTLDIAIIVGLTDQQIEWLHGIDHHKDGNNIVIDIKQLGDVLARLAQELRVTITC